MSAQKPQTAEAIAAENIDNEALRQYLAVTADADVKKRLARNWLSGREGLFRETGNPVFAWQIYDACRSAGVAIPDIVLRHIDQVARGVLVLAERAAIRPGQISVHDLAGILAPSNRSRRGQGGLQKFLLQAANFNRDIRLALEVKSLRAQGVPLLKAQRKVAGRKRTGHRGGLSLTTVRNAWNRYGKQPAVALWVQVFLVSETNP